MTRTAEKRARKLQVSIWKATHALGPLRQLSFKHQVKPVIKAACRLYFKSPHDSAGRATRLRHTLEREQVDLPWETSRRIARDCWDDLHSFNAES